jgi:hypothetical protein
MNLRKKILILIFLMLYVPAYSEAVVSEEAVKAAFIFHFINYTEWNDNEPDYYVCIPEDTALRLTAEEMFEGKKVNNRNVQVVSRYKGCHILVSDSPAKSNDSMLTIGSLDKGAQFEFRIVANKLKFAANLDQIKKSKIKISSQLLKLAIVDEPSLQ